MLLGTAYAILHALRLHVNLRPQATEPPPDAPLDDESIEAYDRRMSGADVPESPALARLRALNTYRKEK
jgi:hypothetical protein